MFVVPKWQKAGLPMQEGNSTSQLTLCSLGWQAGSFYILAHTIFETVSDKFKTLNNKFHFAFADTAKKRSHVPVTELWLLSSKFIIYFCSVKINLGFPMLSSVSRGCWRHSRKKRFGPVPLGFLGRTNSTSSTATLMSAVQAPSPGSHLGHSVSG